MTNLILNTDRRTFLVELQFKMTENIFLVQGAEALMNVLKKYDLNGIKYIKELDRHKHSFKRISKKDILNFASWETEAFIYLQNHYYFKK